MSDASSVDKSRKARSAQDIIAAIAVAGLAFWAPGDDSGYFMRVVSAVLGVVGLLLASVGLEMFQEWRTRRATPKSNPFEVKISRVDVPTAPPGGVFTAARNMSQHLENFPLDENSRVTTTEAGFQVLSGTAKLRVKVLPGSAIGWEAGGEHWASRRDEWIEAVRAAPTAALVKTLRWMGVTTLEREAEPAAHVIAEGDVVLIEGVEKKPALNGKYAAVIRSANEAGRVGVRPAGEKEPILLSTSKLTAVSPFDKTGVSIPCLRSFRAELAASLDGLSAAEAVASVIMPLTESFGSSLASGLQRQNKTDEAGKPFAAKATAFVCYADGCSLTALLDAIERYAAAQPKPEEIYVWLDLFSADQHAKKAELPLLWWQTSYRAAIKAIGTTCLVLDPWDAEASGPLRRSSCHATLHAAISSETPIKVALTAAEEGRLKEALLEQMDAPMKLLDTRVDGWKKLAEGSSETERALVEKLIEGKGGEGYERFGEKLADVLHKWLLERAKLLLDDLPPEERETSTLIDKVTRLLQDFNELEAAEPLCRAQVAGRTKKLGENHADTLDAVNNLAHLLHQLGKLEEAEPFSQRKLAGTRATQGDNHPDTITAIDTTSQLLSDLGRLEEALPLKRESLREKRRTLGDRHPDTLLSVNNLAVLLNDLGRSTGNLKMLSEAEPLKREALQGCREVLGNRHPHTLASIANLADLLMQLAPCDPRAIMEAEPLAKESLQGCREVLGNNHPETLKSVGMLAALYVEQAHSVNPQHPKYKEARRDRFTLAEPLYREAVAGFSQGLGPYNPTSLSYVHELARVLLDLEKPTEAEAVQTEAVKGCRAKLGDGHPETLVALTHMTGVYRELNKLPQAEKLAREARKGWIALEGGQKGPPRNTLSSTNVLAQLLHAQGKDKEAEPFCKEVLGGFLRACGPKHPFTLSAAENFAGVLFANGKTGEGEGVLRQMQCRDPRKGPLGPPGAAGVTPGVDGPNGPAIDFNAPPGIGGPRAPRGMHGPPPAGFGPTGGDGDGDGFDDAD